MSSKRVAGVTSLTIDGERFQLKGNLTINLGQPKREAVVGADGVHGYKEMPQAPSMSGELTDIADISLKDKILNMTDSTVSASAANGKTYFVEGAFYTGDGNIETEEGKIQFECGGMTADEVLP